MIFFKKTLLTSVAIIIIIPYLALAEDVQQVTFKDVMKDLLINTQQITKGIVLEDFSLIEQAATRIVNHPKPDLAVRMKLVKAMGSEMSKFKAKDTIVHNSATKLVEAAKTKNMLAVSKEYQVLVNGCLACHSRFKEKVTNILK